VFRGEETERELDVVPRGAHDMLRRLAVQEKLERLLGRDGVVDVLPRRGRASARSGCGAPADAPFADRTVSGTTWARDATSPSCPHHGW
jgi:hypothetical protein